MRLPTTTVAGFLLATAILSFDMAAVELLGRGASWPSWEAEVLLAVLPSFTALMIALYLIAPRTQTPG